MIPLSTDWRANPHDVRIRLCLLVFRAGGRASRARGLGKLPAAVFLIFYRLFLFWFAHLELPAGLQVGARLRIFHGYGLVVNPDSVLGNDVILRHGVTIGNGHPGGGSPVLEDGVEVGAHAIIIGAIRIGRGAVIGAGAVVTHDVPPGAIVAGNPARIIGHRDVNAA